MCCRKALPPSAPKPNIVLMKRWSISVMRLISAALTGGEINSKFLSCMKYSSSVNKDEEYFMQLRNFELISPPVRAAEIKRITEIDHRFMSTMFGLGADGGKALRQHIHDRQARH